MRFRPPPGSNFELTRQMAVRCLEEIEREAKPENIAITMGFVGQVAPNFGIDNMVLFMRGPDDGQLRVALEEDSGIKLAEFRERLREVLPKRVIPWLAARLVQGGLSESNAALEQAKKSTFGFAPGDIVTQVMSFGSSTPIAVQLVGTDLDDVRTHAEKIASEMKRILFLRDVQFEQTLDYPTVEVAIDREKAGLSDVTVEDVRKALVMATSSTRFTDLNYWIDVNTGFDYLVEVLMPPTKMIRAEDVETLPIGSVNPLVNLMIRDHQAAAASPKQRTRASRSRRPCRWCARRSGRSYASSDSRASSKVSTRTSIYPKLDAYIEKWKVDIGDTVKKGDLLATLYVPELVEDFGTKKATVELDKSRIEQANKLVNVAEANVEAATARLAEARAILGKFQAEVDRWETEIKRLRQETERGIIDPQILLESTNEWKSALASRDSAKATIMTQQADLLSREACASESPRRRQGRPRRSGRRQERGEAARGLGGLPHAQCPLRRRDRDPQCQHRRLRPARHG